MSYIDELRERFLSAEQRFGQIGEASRAYRERLMGLMSRIEEEIRCRRDVEQQQAKEIERLSGEITQLSGENEQLRTMMMSLLTAVETGNSDGLGDTLNDMDRKVATLIGEGQGAVAVETPAAGDPDDDTGEAVEDEMIAAPVFSAGDMMSTPAEQEPISAETESEPDAYGAVEDDAVSGPALAGSELNVASEIADFFDADDQGGADDVPDYANAVAGWEDFLEDDTASAEAAHADTATDAGMDTVSETSDDGSLFDDGAEESGEADPGSIHKLMDRVKTEIEGDDDLDLDDDDDKSAAQ